LPFVFLIWAVRPGVLSSRQLDLLRDCFHRAVCASKAIAREWAWYFGISENLSAEFVGDHRRFYLDDFLLHGLEEFIVHAQKQKLLSSVHYSTVRRNLFGEVVCKPAPLAAWSA
jgi:hypothetical protein